MLKNFSFIFLLVLLLTACAAEAAPVTTIAAPTDAPLSTATSLPTGTALPAPSATLTPTETAIPEPTRDPSIFGFINTADAPVGFMLAPVAQAIFEGELQKRVDAGEINGFQTEGLSIVPRGDGTFFAEIFYALQADTTYWAEDFGTPADDGWVRGKCTRLDFESRDDGYYLKNKAVCN